MTLTNLIMTMSIFTSLFLLFASGTRNSYFIETRNGLHAHPPFSVCRMTERRRRKQMVCVMCHAPPVEILVQQKSRRLAVIQRQQHCGDSFQRTQRLLRGYRTAEHSLLYSEETTTTLFVSLLSLVLQRLNNAVASW
jgi:hypothetical protein